MKEHGIAFSPDMLKAIREGRKTQTRRIKPRAIKPGDRVWVKEELYCGNGEVAHYTSDSATVYDNTSAIKWAMEWAWSRPSLSARFMPKRAARTWLEVTGVRFERLQAIKKEDVQAEGFEWLAYCPEWHTPDPTEMSDYWNMLHKKHGERWQDNPMVQVIEFKLNEESK